VQVKAVLGALPGEIKAENERDNRLPSLDDSCDVTPDDEGRGERLLSGGS